MKRRTQKKMKVQRETLGRLDVAALEKARGGVEEEAALTVLACEPRARNEIIGIG